MGRLYLLYAQALGLAAATFPGAIDYPGRQRGVIDRFLSQIKAGNVFLFPPLEKGYLGLYIYLRGKPHDRRRFRNVFNSTQQFVRY